MDFWALSELVSEEFSGKEIDTSSFSCKAGSTKAERYAASVTLRVVKTFRMLKKGQASRYDFEAALRTFLMVTGSKIHIPNYTLTADNRFGLNIDQNGDIYVNYDIPKYLVDKFVRDSYLLSYTDTSGKEEKPILANGYISSLTGFKGFKSVEQQLAVTGALKVPKGYTALVAMKTGGGKSLITQSVAYQYENGLTIVIVPTISLMLDQTASAKRLIKSDNVEKEIMCYYSGCDENAVAKAIDRKEVRLLFLSPETLIKNQTLRKKVIESSINGYLSNLIVDEAHIVIEWGSSFREDFQCLDALRKVLLENNPELRTYLLSATYSADTVNALRSFYSIGGRWIELRFDHLRKEQRYNIVKCGSYYEKHTKLTELVCLLPHPMIIYVNTPSDAESVRDELLKLGYKNTRIFTGKTNSDERKKIIDEWENDDFDLMVATCAFGVGVDKKDVRTVIHLYIPSGSNQYYQECGRGGRDGLPCLSIMLYTNDDIQSAYKLSQKVLTTEKLLGRWFSLIDSNKTKKGINSTVIDTSIKPTYNEDDEFFNYVNNADVSWNVYVILLLRKNGLLSIENVEFLDDRYLFYVKINDFSIEVIVSYINSFIDDVVRSCAGIEAGDFQQIFKEIRRELYKQHKSLILLVEDITSFTGINKELLNALVTEHTGLNANDNMCRLISVVGTTSEYYKTFRDNYVDRITSQITINDGTIGENDNDLVQFVARYLNAISIERDELEKWQKNGAVLSEMPIHTDLNADIWGNYEMDGRRMSLYPFNERSIKLLFRAMPNAKTPRYIIREIIEPGVNEIISSPSDFPSFCTNWRSPMDEVEKEAELNMIINSVKELAVSENDKAKIRSRVSTLIGFWGNCKLTVSKNGALAGINKAIFIQIGLNEVYNKFGKNTEPEDDTLIVEKDSSSKETSSQVIAPPVVTIDPEQEKRKQDYNAFRNCVLRWHTDKVKLVRFQEVRDEICSFAYNTINWQQSGVPVALMDVLENTKMELIGFDRQDQGIEKTLIVLPDNDETYQLLLCFGKWKYLGKKSWNYSNAVSDAYFATKWLEKHKKEIVSTVLGTVEGGVPVYTKAAMILELYRRILNCSLKASRISELSRDDFIADYEARDQTISQNTGYTTEWNAVLDLIYSNAPQLKNEFIKKNFNLVMGSMLNSSKIIFNRSLFNKALKSLKDSDFTVQPLDKEAIDLKIKPKAEMNEFCQRIISKSERAAKSMYDQGKTIRSQIMEYFGYDDDLELDSGDIRSMLDKIAEFYEEAIRTGVNIIQQKNIATEMKKRADDIAKAVNSLNFEYDDKKQFEILVLFSDNPIRKLLPFLQLLKQASSDCDNVIQLKNNEKEQLTRSGKWEGDFDSRFEINADKFNCIYKNIFGGDTDVG